MKLRLVLLCAMQCLYGEEMAAKSAGADGIRTLYSIDPKNRSADWVQAFDELHKDKPTLKIMIKTTNGIILSNISEIDASSNGSLLFVKLPSNQGVKTQVIPVEDVAEVNYQP